MQGSSFSQLFLLLSLQISNHIFKILKIFTASPLRWKQSLLPLLSPVCVLTSQTVLKLMIASLAQLAKSFTFSCCHAKFSFIFFYFSFFHIIKAFLPSHKVNLISKLLWKVCFWKSAPHPHSKYLFSTFNSSVQFCKKQYVKFLFSPTQLVCFLFWHSQRLFMRISWHFVVYPGKYSEKYFYPGKYFISQDPLLAVHRCQSVTTIEGIAFLFLLFFSPASSWL